MISWPPYLVPIIENNALHNLYFLVTLCTSTQAIRIQLVGMPTSKDLVTKKVRTKKQCQCPR